MTPSEIARQYINKLEKPGNTGFKDPEFEKDMRELGEWQKGYSWCACFAQMCFRKAMPERSEELKKLFDPSTRKTFENFKEAGFNIFKTPVKDSLVIWSDFVRSKPTWKGHAGIVSELIDQNTFKSIEGNTSGGGSRNGDRVYEHTRSTAPKADGLNVLGFIVI